jgi:hypothetical protein
MMGADEQEHPDARRAAREGLILLAKLEADTPMSLAEKDKAARAALQRAQAARRKPLAAPKATATPTIPKLKPVVSFIYTWTEMRDWPHEYDPQAVANILTDAQWEQFCQTVVDTIEFRDTVAQLRR